MQQSHAEPSPLSVITAKSSPQTVL